MSALGHKRTFALQWTMSALPPKADMCGALGHVRFGPKTDIEPLLDKSWIATAQRFDEKQAS